MVSIEDTVGDLAGVIPVSRYEWERMVRGIAIPSQVKFLALMMATYSDPDGTRIRPGVERLALVMCVGEKTVKRSLGSLRDSGLVVRVKQGNRHTGQFDEYRLTSPRDLTLKPVAATADAVPQRPLPEWRTGYMTYPDGTTRVPADRHEWLRVVRRVQLNSGVKYMALMVATYGNADGTRIFPGGKRLALVMCVGKKIVDRDLPALRDLGFVERVGHGNRHAQESDEYRLTYPQDLARLPMLAPNELSPPGSLF